MMILFRSPLEIVFELAICAIFAICVALAAGEDWSLLVLMIPTAFAWIALQGHKITLCKNIRANFAEAKNAKFIWVI